MCNDRGQPWFNDKISLLIKEKTTAYKYFRQNGNDACWQHRLKVPHDHLNNSIEFLKEKYYNKNGFKLQNTKKNFKMLLVFTENILKQ